MRPRQTETKSVSSKLVIFPNQAALQVGHDSVFLFTLGGGGIAFGKAAVRHGFAYILGYFLDAFPTSQHLLVSILSSVP